MAIQPNGSFKLERRKLIKIGTIPIIVRLGVVSNECEILNKNQKNEIGRH